jgi:UDP-N-acetylmuramoyl-tripeptide--D-alanyl-D-alanine ligase
VIAMTLREIADVVSGVLHDVPDADARVTGSAFIDSRKAVPGGLFAALPGERADGHDYACGAVADGAAAVLAARPVGAPAIVVPDVTCALGQLAAHMIARRPDLTVIGVTGSAGKTGTKDLVGQLLSEAGPTVATPGNFNNEIGLPVTVSLIEPETRFLVLEMGARGIGHIEYLARIASPRVGVVLNVGTAHIGEFGGVEAIARGKGELVEALPADGLAILNADDARVRAMAAHSRGEVTLFGRSPDAEVRAEQVRIDDAGRPGFVLCTEQGAVPVSLQLVGEYQVSNALAAAAVAQHAGLGLERIAAALSTAVPVSRWRMEITERADGITIVNDAYNANPTAMRAALTAVAALAGGRRIVAVFGPMLELGRDEEAEHARLGTLAAESGVGVVVAVGDQRAATVQEAAKACGADAEYAADRAEALRILRSVLEPGDVVLVKASRAAGLEVLADRLLQLAPTAQPNP